MVEEPQNDRFAEGQQSLFETDSSLSAYTSVLTEILELMQQARSTAARSVNSITGQPHEKDAIVWGKVTP